MSECQRPVLLKLATDRPALASQAIPGKSAARQARDTLLHTGLGTSNAMETNLHGSGFKQGSSENYGGSYVYDRSEFKVIYNCCYINCCNPNCCHTNWIYLKLPEFTWIYLKPEFTLFTWIYLNSLDFTWIVLNSPEFTWISLKSP